MPVYTYHCGNCGHRFDRHQSFDEKAIEVCPNCGQETLHKVYQPAGVVFKGSGFYVNDRKTGTASSNGKGSLTKPKPASTSQNSVENKADSKKPGKQTESKSN